MISDRSSQPPSIPCIIGLTKRVKCVIDSDRIGCASFVDILKAFDAIGHQILLQNSITKV